MTLQDLSRRDFGKLFALAAVGRAAPALALQADAWAAARAEFALDSRYIVMNAANFCPATRKVNEVLFRYTEDMDANPSQQSRAKFSQGREETRRKIAAFLNVTAEEI